MGFPLAQLVVHGWLVGVVAVHGRGRAARGLETRGAAF